LYLRLLSSAVPNPAYCRMVQKRPRYMVGWTPRVKGYSPGKPRSRPYSCSAASSGVYTRFQRDAGGGDEPRLTLRGARQGFLQHPLLPRLFLGFDFFHPVRVHAQSFRNR